MVLGVSYKEWHSIWVDIPFLTSQTESDGSETTKWGPNGKLNIINKPNVPSFHPYAEHMISTPSKGYHCVAFV